MSVCHGCSRIASNGRWCNRCIQVRKVRYVSTPTGEKRGPYYKDPKKKKQRYTLNNDPRWKKLRNQHINANPLCEKCKLAGKLIAGEDVDHIKPVRLCPELSFNPDNLQTLCGSCHKSKTGAEKRLKIAYDYKRKLQYNLAGYDK